MTTQTIDGLDALCAGHRSHTALCDWIIDSFLYLQADKPYFARESASNHRNLHQVLRIIYQSNASSGDLDRGMSVLHNWSVVMSTKSTVNDFVIQRSFCLWPCVVFSGSENKKKKETAIRIQPLHFRAKSTSR